MEGNTSPFKLILGSASAPRRQVLAEMGYEFITMSADIDEKAIRKEKPEDLVMALAEAKAEAIIPRLNIDESMEDAEPMLLITCDQIYFHEIPEDVMDKLIEEGTVLYVAGGLLIEHPLIQPYIKRVAGATDSVMGLPKALTQRLITEVL